MTDGWHTMTVAELGRVVTGKTPPTAKPHLYGTGYPFITPTDIGELRYCESSRELSEQGRESQRNLLLPINSVCMTCIASVGKMCMTNRPSFTNQQINSVIVDETHHDPFFVYYLLQTRVDHLKAIAGGAATPIVNKTAFSEVEVTVPPLPVQRRIAGILSAYDELMENNRRRIRLLEAMARALYREWFVRPCQAGKLPKGWETKKLGEIADIRWGDTSTTKASYVEDGHAAYSASGLDGKLDHFDFDRTGIVLSAIGAQCGKTWLARGKWSCIKNTIRFWSKDDCVSTEFLYIATEGQDFWPRRGAAQPFISQGDAERKELLIPDGGTMGRFTAFAKDALERIDVLETQTANLRRTRDLLLPRLLSGQISL